MSFSQNIFSDKGVQVDIHVFEDQIDILIIVCPYNLLETDYMRVGEFCEEHDFPVGTLGIGGVVKGVEVLLQRLDLV